MVLSLDIGDSTATSHKFRYPRPRQVTCTWSEDEFGALDRRTRTGGGFKKLNQIFLGVCPPLVLRKQKGIGRHFPLACCSSPDLWPPHPGNSHVEQAVGGTFSHTGGRGQSGQTQSEAGMNLVRRSPWPPPPPVHTESRHGL